jgi:hypothetical protein
MLAIGSNGFPTLHHCTHYDIVIPKMMHAWLAWILWSFSYITQQASHSTCEPCFHVAHQEECNERVRSRCKTLTLELLYTHELLPLHY